MTALSHDVKNDVFMVRNFGKLARH
jgi:hypothetical protein